MANHVRESQQCFLNLTLPFLTPFLFLSRFPTLLIQDFRDRHVHYSDKMVLTWKLSFVTNTIMIEHALRALSGVREFL
jgi:hypothetical protein